MASKLVTFAVTSTSNQYGKSQLTCSRMSKRVELFRKKPYWMVVCHGNFVARKMNVVVWLDSCGNYMRYNTRNALQKMNRGLS
jgi:hypothetical protein